MLAFIISLLSLGIIIFFHELGHFLMARKNNVGVEEFGIGYPPKVFSFKKNNVTYSLNAIPFGGFTKIKEYGTEDSFAAQSIGKRASILIAGVIANLIIAFLIFMILFNVGMPIFALPESYQDKAVSYVAIKEVVKDSPAFKAGLEKGDIIKTIKYLNESFVVNNVQDVQDKTAELEGKKVQLVIERKDSQVELEVALRESAEAEKGYLGVILAEEGYLKYSFLESIKETIIFLGVLFQEIFKGLGRIFVSLFKHGKLEELTGPVGIVAITTQGFKWGWNYGFYILGLISFGFAVFNLLPIPAVDGGRILFLIIEKIRKRPITQKTELLINNVFFILLVVLLFIITIKDINLFILKN